MKDVICECRLRQCKQSDRPLNEELTWRCHHYSPFSRRFILLPGADSRSFRLNKCLSLCRREVKQLDLIFLKWCKKCQRENLPKHNKLRWDKRTTSIHKKVIFCLSERDFSRRLLWTFHAMIIIISFNIRRVSLFCSSEGFYEHTK